MSAVRVRLGRIEAPALVAVWIREWTVFRYYWRTRTFAAIVEPVITLLAFGFGFGKLVSDIDGIPYIQFVGTGAVATAVLFSAVFSAMFDALYKRRYQRVYDAMLAAPVDVDEIVTGESLFLGVRAGVYGVAPLLVAFLFGLRPEPAMVLVPLIGALTGIGFAALGMWFAAMVSTYDGFSYVISGVITPLFLVAGRSSRSTGCRSGCSRWPSSTRCTTASSWSATARSGCIVADLVHVGALCAVRGPGLVARCVADTRQRSSSREATATRRGASPPSGRSSSSSALRVRDSRIGRSRCVARARRATRPRRTARTRFRRHR